MKRYVAWVLLALVVAVDVVSIVFDLPVPGARIVAWVLVALLGVGLAAFAALRLLEWRQIRANQRAAYEVLERHRAARARAETR